MTDLLTTRRNIIRRKPFQSVADALVARFSGPGGYYNAGNLLGLAAALAVQFGTVAEVSARTSVDILMAFLAGSPASLALTGATVIFLASGEVYHRAWDRRTVPDACLNRAGDVLSAAGAFALTLGLMFAGQSGLAVASGVLIMGGKLGSAVFGDNGGRPAFWPVSWPHPFRAAVFVGRVPGVAAAAASLLQRLASDTEPALSVMQAAVLVVCYLLWIKADLLLIGNANATAQAARS